MKNGKRPMTGGEPFEHVTEISIEEQSGYRRSRQKQHALRQEHIEETFGETKVAEPEILPVELENSAAITRRIRSVSR